MFSWKAPRDSEATRVHAATWRKRRRRPGKRLLTKWEGLAMRGTRVLCSLIAVSLSIVIGASTDSKAQTTALRGARVIDGRGGAPIDNATIVIRDSRIVAIGSSAATPIPSDAEVVDYTGKTIIPGLISAHSHVGIFVGLKGAPENYSRDIILRQLKQLEAYGVTTVMALGLNGPLFYELRPELHAGRLPRCRPLRSRPRDRGGRGPAIR